MCIHELREEIQEMLPKCEKVLHDKKVFKYYELGSMFKAIDIFPHIEKDWKTINYTVWKQNDFGIYTYSANTYITKANNTVHKDIIATCIPSLKLVIIVER